MALNHFEAILIIILFWTLNGPLFLPVMLVLFGKVKDGTINENSAEELTKGQVARNPEKAVQLPHYGTIDPARYPLGLSKQKHYSETDYKTQVGCYISTHLYNTVDMWIALDFPSQVEMKAGSLWIKLSLQIATKELILKYVLALIEILKIIIIWGKT